MLENGRFASESVSRWTIYETGNTPTFPQRNDDYIQEMQVNDNWGWVTHTCVSKLTITGSNKGLIGDKPLSELMLEYW